MNLNYFISSWTTRPRLHKVRAMNILSFLSNIQDLGCFFVFASWATSKTLCFLCVLLKHPRRCVFYMFFSSSRASKTLLFLCVQNKAKSSDIMRMLQQLVTSIHVVFEGHWTSRQFLLFYVLRLGALFFFGGKCVVRYLFSITLL
jgi:hypothetical protein